MEKLFNVYYEDVNKTFFVKQIKNAVAVVILAVLLSINAIKLEVSSIARICYLNETSYIIYSEAIKRR